MKNWKTTLCGAVTAIGVALMAQDDPIMKLVGGVVAALGALLTGVFAKDSNVTGGTKPQ